MAATSSAWSSPKAHQQQARSFCYQCGLERTPTPAVGWDEDQEPACAVHMVKAAAPLKLSEPIELPPCVAEPIAVPQPESQSESEVKPMRTAKNYVGEALPEYPCKCGCGQMVRGKDYAWGHKTKARSVPRENITDKTVATMPPPYKGPALHVLELTAEQIDQALIRAIQLFTTEQKLELLRSVLVPPVSPE